jgi:GDP-L-fucose synthase
MRIVVTGGNGMVGKCIKDFVSENRELHRYHDFTFTTRENIELTNYLSVLQYFSSNKFDYIIHLAADVGGLYKNMNQNDKMMENNLLINLNILNACKKYKINRGVFILSSCIYPCNPKQFPMDESIIHNGPPHYSNEGYAYAKRMLEVQCRLMNNLYNTEYFCLIPVNLYGPYDNFNVDNGHFISSILHRFYLSKLVGKNCTAYGTGKPLRQFLYAPDFAKIICNILFHLPFTKINQNIVICDDNEYTIKNVVDKIQSIMDINEIKWDSTLSDGCMKKTVSNEKFKNITRKYEKIWDWNWKSLDDGLKESHKWLLNNYEIARK